MSARITFDFFASKHAFKHWMFTSTQIATMKGQIVQVCPACYEVLKLNLNFFSEAQFTKGQIKRKNENEVPTQQHHLYLSILTLNPELTIGMNTIFPEDIL